MPIVKVRDLSKYGIISDLDPYDLPPQAFSSGVNARFRNGRVTRGPVFRNAKALVSATPRFVFSNNPTSGLDNLYVGYQDGSVYLTTPASATNVSISGYAGASSEGVWTNTHLADVLYVNREDRVPWFIRSTDTAFQTLGGGWDATWRCKLLRACGGALVALNVTKGATAFPTMVKTSSFALSGSIPASWDITDTATNASENILAELEGPIIDAQSFGNNMVIYGRDQAWLMQKVSAFELFDYFKLPFSKGAISANCSVEIDGKHYVFGPDDLWVHDGTSEQSLVDGQNRDFIFNSLDASKSSRCFVVYNAAQREVHFCYPSGDALVSFAGGGCNRQAVLNLVTNTWTFDDLPLVYAGTRSNLDSTATYASVSTTYATAGGTYQDQEASLTRTVCYVGETAAAYSLTASLYAFDFYGLGSTVGFPVDTNATKPLQLFRDGIDLHAIDPEMDLAGYIQVNSIWPLGRGDSLVSSPLSFQFGSADFYGQAAIFDIPPMTYDGNTNYKLDYNVGGRYLSLKITVSGYDYISLSGFDLDVDEVSAR